MLACMLLLAPRRDHAVLANAIAAVVESESPLFKEDDDKRKTAALLVAVAYRESGFALDAVGDNGTSWCALQISNAVGGGPALLTDANACVREGLRMLRWSIRACPAHPVAMYAAGMIGCTNARAQRISRDRMAIAARLVRETQPIAQVSP